MFWKLEASHRMLQENFYYPFFHKPSPSPIILLIVRPPNAIPPRLIWRNSLLLWVKYASFSAFFRSSSLPHTYRNLDEDVLLLLLFYSFPICFSYRSSFKPTRNVHDMDASAWFRYDKIVPAHMWISAHAIHWDLIWVCKCKLNLLCFLPVLMCTWELK